MLTIKRPRIPDSHKFRESVSRWKSPLWSGALYKLVGPVYRDRTTEREVEEFTYTTLEGRIISGSGKGRINYCSHLKYDGEFLVCVKPSKSGNRGFFVNKDGCLSYEGELNWRKQVVSESSESQAARDYIDLDTEQNKQWTKYQSTRGQCRKEYVRVYNQIHHDPSTGKSWWSTEGSGQVITEDVFERVSATGCARWQVRVYYKRTTTQRFAAQEHRTTPAGFPQYAGCITTVEHLYQDIDAYQTDDLSNEDDCFWPLWLVKNEIDKFGNSLRYTLPKYTEQLAVEAYDDTCKQLSSNNIENAVQLRGTISSAWQLPMSLIRKAKQFASLVRDMKRLDLDSLMKSGKTIASAASELHLWWRYVFKPAKKDFEELLEFSKKMIRRTGCLNGQWTTARSHGQRVIYPDGETPVTVDRRFSCSIRSSYPGGTPLARMRAYGVDLSLANAWDLVPYSFVLDWFIEVGPWLQTIDAYFAYASYNVKDRCYSAKARIDLGAVRTLSQYGQGGRVKAYLRDPLRTVQFPSLPVVAQGKSYKLTAAALLVQYL